MASKHACQYSDRQVRDMLKNSALWVAELRVAAEARGFGTSVTPIGEIIDFLRREVSRG